MLLSLFVLLDANKDNSSFVVEKRADCLAEDVDLVVVEWQIVFLVLYCLGLGLCQLFVVDEVCSAAERDFVSLLVMGMMSYWLLIGIKRGSNYWGLWHDGG